MSTCAALIISSLVLSQAVFATGANAHCGCKVSHIVNNPIRLTSSHAAVVNVFKPTTSITLPKVPVLTIHPTVPTIHR
jgi:hypothetical protein